MMSTMRFKSTATLILRLMMETKVAMSIYSVLIMIGRIGKVELRLRWGKEWDEQVSEIALQGLQQPT
jgi:hypothetical protein